MPAWVHRMISDDLALIVFLAGAAVVLIAWMQFRRVRHVAVVTLALAVGVVSFLGLMKALDQDLNMFSIVAIPCIVGIGIDDVIHIYHRYLRLGRGSVWTVVRRTGAAVVLTSLTTGAGFGALLLAHHRGLRSLGIACLLGVVATLTAAILFLPCLVTVLEGSRTSCTD